MAYTFEHGGFQFSMSAGYPPVSSEDERDCQFHEAFADVSRLRGVASIHAAASWLMARLAYITSRAIEQEIGGQVENDGGAIAFRFTVKTTPGELVGKFGVVFYLDRIEFAGFSKGSHNVRDIFIRLLTGEPDNLERCRVDCRHMETRRSTSYGWDGRNLL